MEHCSMAQAITCLRIRERRFFDLRIPAKEVRMNEDGTMKIGSFLSSVPLQEQALLTLANRIGVQAGYLRRCADDLFDLRAENVNRWLAKLPRDKEFFVRMDGAECRAILSTSYTPVGNLALMERFQESCPVLNGNVKVNLELNPVAMAAQLYWTTTEYSVELTTPGDISHLGFQIGNSEVGFHSVEIAAFMFRLVCSNGLVVSEKAWSVKQTHLSKTDQLDSTFDELPRIMDQLPHVGKRLQAATRIPVENPIAEIEKIANRHALPRRQLELVLLVYQLNVDPTMFGVINSFTGAANEKGICWETRRTLQRAGGAILAGVQAN